MRRRDGDQKTKHRKIEMTDVFANGRSILHKGHGKTQLATAPDVCKTPTPGGPVPVPYPNFSPDSNLTKGTKTVKINGNPVANIDSQLSRSSGDEPGTAGGVVSSRNMGTFGWPAGSIDVDAEGKSVVRLLDSSLTNGNTYNDGGVNLGETGLGYGDDAQCPRTDCKLGRVIEKHRIPETIDVANLCATFSQECADKAKTHMKKPKYGRMIGVAICECRTWKAISGPPASEDVANRMGSEFCNTVADRPGDPFFNVTTALNPTWECAALKILSNAAGHKILALSEKWLGKESGDGRVAKTFTDQKFTFPVKNLDGSFNPLPMSRSDRVRGLDEKTQSIPSGGSVPSCGKCQTFLPALVCEMKPCP